jgi:hypothetical protein
VHTHTHTKKETILTRKNVYDCQWLNKKSRSARHRWLTPVILATREAEIRRIMVRSQPRQIVRETLSQNTLHKNRAGRVAQGKDHGFKPRVQQQKKNQDQIIWAESPNFVKIINTG